MGVMVYYLRPKGTMIVSGDLEHELVLFSVGAMIVSGDLNRHDC